MSSTPPAPGDLFWLPPAASQLSDPLSHPHALLVAAPQIRHTLVMGSTKDTVPARSNACCLVQPDADNQLSQQTWFLGCVLARAAAAHVRRRSGLLSMDDFTAVRCATALAFGLGSGVGLDPGPACRGRIVRLGPSLAKPSTTWALVVTEFTYSARGEFQLIVPLVDATGRPPRPDGPEPITAPILATATRGALTQALPAIELVQSVWQRKHIAELTRQTLSAEPVDAIARAAMRYLQLPEA